MTKVRIQQLMQQSIVDMQFSAEKFAELVYKEGYNAGFDAGMDQGWESGREFERSEEIDQ